MKEEMQLVAKTFKGLEDVLAEELRQLGAGNVTPGTRMVSFTGDKRMLYKANFCCRTALKILKPIVSFKARDTDELYEEAKRFEWDTLLGADETFAIDSTVNSEEFRHSKFVVYRVKDAIADYYMEKYGRRPSIRLVGADMQLNVHIYNNEVTISLDSSGESLYKRGYRVDQTEAPINEVLAAGLLLKAGWDGSQNLVDPMCGSGTFLIEAALIATNTYPGIFRKSIAFEPCKEYEPESAGVSKYVDLKVMPFEDYTEAPANGMLITNPPYGERLSLEDVDAFYDMIGSKLKNVFKGYHAWIIAHKPEHFNAIGLKPSTKLEVNNGALDCEFREYVMFDGTFAEFRKQGRTIKGEKKERKADSGERRAERGRRRDRREPPRNALEREYRKPFGERVKNKERRDERGEDREPSKAERFVRFRQPRLYSEEEVNRKGEVTMRHRHKKETSED